MKLGFCQVRIADWRVMLAAGLVLALGCAREASRPHPARGTLNGASPSALAPASPPSVVPVMASSARPEVALIPLEELNG